MNDAVISSCGQYRYTLTRHIPQHTKYNTEKKMLFIMLNPSTADAKLDDPTIRRCISFAQREGATEMTVVNLFAFRATDPKSLTLAHDPVGPLNDYYLKQELRNHYGCPIVAAWGAHKFAAVRALEVHKIFNGQLDCLGKTKDGHPRHPLYLKSDSKLQWWEPKRV